MSRTVLGLVVVAVSLPIAGCDLYFPGRNTPPPDAYLACGGCDAAHPPDAFVPDAAGPDAPPCGAIEAEDLGSAAGWSQLAGDDMVGGRGLTADTAGVSLVVEFVGSGLSMRYETGADMGGYVIRVDGGEPVPIDAHSDADFAFVTSTIATGLPYATHSASVVCASLYCSVDDFPIACVAP